jgi:hypothetical protein
MQRAVVISYRHFGTTYWSLWLQKSGPIGCSETSVNYHHSHPLCGWILKSCTSLCMLCYTLTTTLLQQTNLLGLAASIQSDSLVNLSLSCQQQAVKEHCTRQLHFHITKPSQKAAVKVKLSACTPRRHRREWRIVPFILNLDIRQTWAHSFMPWPLIPLGKSTQYPLNVRLSWLHSQLEWFWEQKCSLCLLWIKPEHLCCPAHSLVTILTELSKLLMKMTVALKYT